MFQNTTFPATMVAVFSSDLVRVHMVASEFEVKAILVSLIANVVPKEKLDECIKALIDRGAVYFVQIGNNLNIEVSSPFVTDIEEEFE